jgi:hypothetical protein
MASDQDWENSGGVPPKINAQPKRQVPTKAHPDAITTNHQTSGAGVSQKQTATGKK